MEEKVIQNQEVKTKRKVEVIDNIVYMSPSPSLRHNTVMTNVHGAFRRFLRGKKCSSHVEPSIHYDDTKSYVIPDVAILCDPTQAKNKRYYGLPSLVVEILSINRKSDLLIKFDLYEKIGVKEYWIIDPISQSIEQYILVNGKYKLHESFVYLSESEILELDNEEQQAYKHFIQPSIFSDCQIELEEIFED